MPHTQTGGPMDYAALGIKVEALEGDVREVKDSILGLNSKFDNAVSSLSQEFRTAISALSGQFAERQRTPWGVLISGAGFMVVVLGIVGGQALSPIISSINDLKANSFPKDEAVFRYSVNDRRLTNLESTVSLMQQRRYDEIVKESEALRSELRQLRGIK